MVAVLCVALWRGALTGARASLNAAHTQAHPAQANAAVYRDQLADLEHEHALGNLNDDELQLGRDELTRRLLDDVDQPVAMRSMAVSDQALTYTTSMRKPWALMLGVIFLVPVLSMGMYSVLGEPQALDPLATQQGVAHDAEVTPEKLAAMDTCLLYTSDAADD